MRIAGFLTAAGLGLSACGSLQQTAGEADITPERSVAVLSRAFAETSANFEGDPIPIYSFQMAYPRVVKVILDAPPLRRPDTDSISQAAVDHFEGEDVAATSWVMLSQALYLELVTDRVGPARRWIADHGEDETYPIMLKLVSGGVLAPPSMGNVCGAISNLYAQCAIRVAPDFDFDSDLPVRIKDAIQRLSREEPGERVSRREHALALATVNRIQANCPNLTGRRPA
jgi:hypothetical protein